MKFKSAIIGLGKIGSAYDEGRLSAAPRSHVGAILGSNDFHLSGVFDPSAKSRALFKKQWGGNYLIHSSLDTLLQNPLDLVVVAASTTEHKLILEKVLAAKPRLIFCEKPFCKNLEEAVATEKKARIANIPILVNYHRRWDPRFKKLEKLFSQYGKPVKVVVTYRKGLLNYGSHAIDFLLRFLGPIEKVFPQENFSFLSSKEQDPSVSFGLKFSNGTSAQFIGVDGAQYELFDFEFYFPKHKVQIVFGGQELTVFEAKTDLWYKGYTNLQTKNFSWSPGLGAHGLLPAYEEIAKFLSAKSKAIGAISSTSSSKNAIEVHQVLAKISKKSRKQK